MLALKTGRRSCGRDPTGGTGGVSDGGTGGVTDGTGGDLTTGGTGGTSTGGSTTGGAAGMTREVDCSYASSGDLTCTGDDVCCAIQSGSNYCDTYCVEGVPMVCDGPEDCAGRPCCFGGQQLGTYCAPGPACDADGDPMCRTFDDCDSSYLCCTRTALGGVDVRFCADSIGSCF